MSRRHSVSVVATASAAIVMTSPAGCSGSAEPPVTARTLPVAAAAADPSIGGNPRALRARPTDPCDCARRSQRRPPSARRRMHPRQRNGGDYGRRPARRRATAQRIGDLDHPRSQSRRCRRRHPAKRSPRRSQPQLPVRMAAARPPRRPAIRRTTATLRARESRRTHADPSPPASAHNLVSSAARQSSIDPEETPESRPASPP